MMQLAQASAGHLFYGPLADYWQTLCFCKKAPCTQNINQRQEAFWDVSVHQKHILEWELLLYF
jgi:hypothetical protein